MSDKRVSQRVSEAIQQVEEATEALEEALTAATSTLFQAGIDFERERIIKLLEQLMATSPLTADIIALIKGEQK